MATDLHVPFITQALTANGATTGLITVASTTGFRLGARVLLKSATVDATELVIDQIVSTTQLALRDPTKTGTLRFDCSPYTTANTALVTQNEQVDWYARQWTWF